jgi:predicted nucleic acid-binding Zn ribbon protein
MSSEPVPLSESLGAVVRSLRAPSAARRDDVEPAPSVIGGVFGRWREAVGDAIARHVQPLRLDGAHLVVEVDDPAWATQLRFLEGNLRERLLEVTGARIDEFEIRVARRSGSASP